MAADGSAGGSDLQIVTRNLSLRLTAGRRWPDWAVAAAVEGRPWKTVTSSIRYSAAWRIL